MLLARVVIYYRSFINSKTFSAVVSYVLVSGSTTFNKALSNTRASAASLGRVVTYLRSVSNSRSSSMSVSKYAVRSRILLVSHSISSSLARLAVYFRTPINSRSMTASVMRQTILMRLLSRIGTFVSSCTGVLAQFTPRSVMEFFGHVYTVIDIESGNELDEVMLELSDKEISSSLASEDIVSVVSNEEISIGSSEEEEYQSIIKDIDQLIISENEEIQSLEDSVISVQSPDIDTYNEVLADASGVTDTDA